ncbi:MAG TPA: polyprenyl synthetase family protein, partial [Gaiellaceae bacterium]|nr:polyprenyl synthetase family protein [Gaiellaceae bacterium]
MHRPDELRELVEARLGELAFSPDLGALEEALRYSLLAGGKRIRPVLCLATGEALGRGPDELVDAACALELVHTFSLVHDDLPALDDDDLRRGRPSAHVRFGEDVAILAGDALLTEAFRLALAYPAPDVARVLADATLGMIGGQYLDVTTNGGLDADGLAELHALKTGRLIRASVLAATAVAGLPEAEREPWAALGAELGLLFQIVDDLLDATATTVELGKTAGKDEAAGK